MYTHTAEQIHSVITHSVTRANKFGGWFVMLTVGPGTPLLYTHKHTHTKHFKDQVIMIGFKELT